MLVVQPKSDIKLVLGAIFSSVLIFGVILGAFSLASRPTSNTSTKQNISVSASEVKNNLSSSRSFSSTIKSVTAIPIIDNITSSSLSTILTPIPTQAPTVTPTLTPTPQPTSIQTTTISLSSDGFSNWQVTKDSSSNKSVKLTVTGATPAIIQEIKLDDGSTGVGYTYSYNCPINTPFHQGSSCDINVVFSANFDTGTVKNNKIVIRGNFNTKEITFNAISATATPTLTPTP